MATTTSEVWSSTRTSSGVLYGVDDSSLRGLIDEHPVAASVVAAVALTAMIMWLLKPKDERW